MLLSDGKLGVLSRLTWISQKRRPAEKKPGLFKACATKLLFSLIFQGKC